MPMLGGGRKLFFWNKLFLNCFIKIEDDKYCIALLYHFSTIQQLNATHKRPSPLGPVRRKTPDTQKIISPDYFSS